MYSVRCKVDEMMSMSNGRIASERVLRTGARDCRHRRRSAKPESRMIR